MIANTALNNIKEDQYNARMMQLYIKNQNLDLIHYLRELHRARHAIYSSFSQIIDWVETFRQLKTQIA